MDISISFHGVPNGFDCFGSNNQDNPYYNTFYTKCPDDIKFLVEIRQINNKAYCYYNYLRYNNILAADGRDGSYYGMSIRCDSYFTETHELYRIFDYIFNFFIKGKLLAQVSTANAIKFKYTINSFSENTSIFQEVTNELQSLMRKSINSNSIIQIPNVKITNGCINLNLNDANTNSVLSGIQQCGRVAISPFYPTDREISTQRSAEQNIQSIQQQYNERINEFSKSNELNTKKLNNSLVQCENQIKFLNQSLSDKENTISKLKEENKDLKNRLTRYHQLGNISDVITPIKKPITELSEAIQRLAPPEERSKSKGGHKLDNDSEHGAKGDKSKSGLLHYLPIINIALLVIVIILLLLNFSKGNNALTESVQAETNAHSQTGKTYEQTPKTWEVDNGNGQSSATSSEDDIEPIPNEELTRIDLKIQGYDGISLKRGLTYTVVAENGNGEGVWEVKGNSFRQIAPNVIKMYVTGDIITITYTEDNAKGYLMLYAQ